MVSAWSAANGISLGQVKVDDKSNEITAIPLLINSLELSSTCHLSGIPPPLLTGIDFLS